MNLLILVFLSLAAFASTEEVISFTDGDHSRVCKLLSSGEFIIERRALNDYQTQTKRLFSTKTQGFQLSCEEIFDSRLGRIVSSVANAYIDIKQSTTETSIEFSPISESVMVVKLNDKLEATKVLWSILVQLPFTTSERVSILLNNGTQSTQSRMTITCNKPPTSNMAKDCTIVAVLN